MSAVSALLGGLGARSLAPPLAAITIKAPTGSAWEFLVLFLVIIIGPPVLERARLPGIIGLLLGGFLIGPHALNVIGAGNTTVPDLSQVGLLYLMFMAGVELDLSLLRVYRRAVIQFGSITLLIPLALGSLVGFSLHWSTPAALLLGSLMASHTLLVYPAVRRAGLATHPAVATAVGATVLTDTASLIVLTAVSSSQLQGGTPLSIAVQILIGLTVVVVFSLVILPRLARLAFRRLGTDRVVRYLLSIAAFLAAATLATSFGIEGIVGAFFAGLGMNRLVPNEGPLMDHIDFFGSVLFVPIFLISVGMLLQPSVMIEGETLKLAGLFIAASMGGKTLASMLTKRTMHLSASETMLILGLTVPQAAATLAATVIGFDIGLFDQSVVNAVLVLILVSIIAATLLVERARRQVPVPHVERQDLGKRILVALEEASQAPTAFSIGARVAAPDAGVVRGLLASSPTDTRVREPQLAELSSAGYAAGVDVDPALLVHRSLAEGILNAVAAQDPSMVLVGQRTIFDSSLGGAGEAVAAFVTTPVVVVIGETSQINEVLLVESPVVRHAEAGDDDISLIAELASRIAGREARRRHVLKLPQPSDLAPGQVCIVPANSEQMLVASDPPAGALMMVVFAPASSPAQAEAPEGAAPGSPS